MVLLRSAADLALRAELVSTRLASGRAIDDGELNRLSFSLRRTFQTLGLTGGRGEPAATGSAASVEDRESACERRLSHAVLPAFDGPFASWLGDRRPWTGWRVFLKVLAAEPLNGLEHELYYRCTGRSASPTTPVTEAWVVVGRRGRKSSMAALLAVYQSLYRIWPRAAGETLRTLVIATSKDQAGLIRSYAEAILRSMPGLERQIVGCGLRDDHAQERD